MASPVSGSSTDLYSSFYNNPAFKQNEMNYDLHSAQMSIKNQQAEWKKEQEQATQDLPSLTDSIS